MSDHAALIDERELDPVTAQPDATATDQAPPFRLDDYATTAGAEAPNANAAPAASSIEPYTDAEIAELAGTLSGFGLPLDVLDDYSRSFIGRALPILTILQAGEALADVGIHKGAGVAQAPAWLRAAAAGVGLAVVTVMTRRQFAQQGGREDEGGDWTATAGAAGADYQGEGGDGA